MHEGLYANVNTLFARFTTPARKFNSLVLENTGKIAEFQVNAVYSYSDIGLRPLREAFRASDVAGLQRLVVSQNEASRTLAVKLLTDSQVLVGLGQDFGKEVQKLLVEDVVPSTVPAAPVSVGTKSAGTKPSATRSADHKPA